MMNILIVLLYANKYRIVYSVLQISLDFFVSHNGGLTARLGSRLMCEQSHLEKVRWLGD